MDQFFEELRKRTEKSPFLRVVILVLPFVTAFFLAVRLISGEASLPRLMFSAALTVIYGYVAWRVVKGT
jgi:hypothetical protein